MPRGCRLRLDVLRGLIVRRVYDVRSVDGCIVFLPLHSFVSVREVGARGTRLTRPLWRRP